MLDIEKTFPDNHPTSSSSHFHDHPQPTLPSIHAAMRLVAAFLAYHSVKHEHLDEILLLIRGYDDARLRARLQRIIVAARQHALSTADPTTPQPKPQQQVMRPAALLNFA